MRKKLLVLIAFFGVLCGGFAQTFTFLQDKVLLNGISSGGKWAYYLLPEEGIYLYDILNGQGELVPGKCYTSSVSDDGVLAGSFQGRAALYVNGQWEELPIPDNPLILETNARGISSDGKFVCGLIDVGLVNGSRTPILWTRQDDGAYTYELLPAPARDYFGRVQQAVDALCCSDDGSVIVGRMVDWTGMINMPVYWKKNAENEWVYNLAGENFIFKEGVEKPVFPEEVPYPDATEYFTAADSLKYNQDIEAYEAGELPGNDPRWNPFEYITNPDSINKYIAAGNVYNAYLEETSRLTDLIMTEVLTGNNFEVTSMSMSFNGRYITSTNQVAIEVPGELRPKVASIPLYIDIETDEVKMVEDVEDGGAYAVSNEGDLFYSTPYMEYTKTSYVLPKGSDTSVNFADWISMKTDGALDIKPYLTFSWDILGYDPETWETVIVESVKDSLVTGAVIPNADGKVFISNYVNPETSAYTSYVIDLNDNGTDNMENTLSSDKISIYPNPATDVINVNGEVEHIQLIDLSGRVVYNAPNTNGKVSVSFFNKGTYILKTISGAKVDTFKIVITN